MQTRWLTLPLLFTLLSSSIFMSLRNEKIRKLLKADELLQLGDLSFTPMKTCRCGIKDSVRKMKIRAGEPVEMPWMAALVARGGWEPFCAGVLVNDRYILTAAHCLRPIAAPDQLQVLLELHPVGSKYGQSRHGVSDIITHMSYDQPAYTWDVALLRLASPLHHFSSQVRPACLPDARHDFTGKSATLRGFRPQSGPAAESAAFLRDQNLLVISNDRCSFSWWLASESHLCAVTSAPRSHCAKNDGGPLLASQNGRYVVIGISSLQWTPCEQSGMPMVFSRVSEVRDWILRNTADAAYCV